PGVQTEGRVEHGGNIGARGGVAQDRGVATRAQGQRQGVDQYGLARACFTRKYRETRLEMDVRLIDDNEVSYVQGSQHGNYSVSSEGSGMWFQYSLRRRVEKQL